MFALPRGPTCPGGPAGPLLPVGPVFPWNPVGPAQPFGPWVIAYVSDGHVVWSREVDV